MAPHSSTIAWKIPWKEEPGRLQSMGSLRVGHDLRLHFHFSLSCTREENGNPLQCSCLENPRDRGAWWAAVYGVAQSRTRLKQLSSSSSMTLVVIAVIINGKSVPCCSISPQRLSLPRWLGLVFSPLQSLWPHSCKRRHTSALENLRRCHSARCPS